MLVQISTFRDEEVRFDVEKFLSELQYLCDVLNEETAAEICPE